MRHVRTQLREASRIACAATSSIAILAALASAALAGCQTVYTKSPVAERSDPTLGAAADGVWLCGEDGEPLLVKTRSDGRLVGAGAGWDPKRETFTFDIWEGIVASTDAGVLLSVEEKGTSPKGWRLMLLEGLKPESSFRADGIVLASEAGTEWFARAVKSGALAGKVSEGGSVHLEGDTATVVKAIREALARHDSPFDRPVVVARRVSRPRWSRD